MRFSAFKSIKKNNFRSITTKPSESLVAVGSKVDCSGKSRSLRAVGTLSLVMLVAEKVSSLGNVKKSSTEDGEHKTKVTAIRYVHKIS